MNYSKTDLKLFELFANKELTPWCLIAIWEDIDEAISFVSWKYPRFWNEEDEDVEIYMSSHYAILWHEPTITDVFRVAEEQWFTMTAWILEMWFWQDQWAWYDIPCDNTVPLLQQEDSTKEELIKLFS